MSETSKGRRGFEEISVWKCGVQHSWERFHYGKKLETEEKQQFFDGTLPFMGADHLFDPDFDPEEDSNDNETNFFEEERESCVPRTSSWRLNLTAMSAHYNLYFVAYGDEVYCYKPVGMFQKVHKTPHFILPLPRSEAGKNTKGALDQHHPHDVNHLIVRNLGDVEILLMACDDGDVIGYHTMALENYADMREEFGAVSSDPPPRPFFHQNVAISAWGLDVHQESRLIAVSSNKREVQIFCFAMHSDDLDPPPPFPWGCDDDRLDELFPVLRRIPRDYHSNTSSPYPTINRRRSFRVVISLGHQGHNIPGVAFTSFANGEAEAVLATDISGNLWELGIWSPGRKVISNSQKQGFTRSGGMGWSVLVLPHDFFLKATTRKEAFGFPLSQCDSEDKCDISRSLALVPNNSLYHPRHGDRLNDPLGTALSGQVGLIANDTDESDSSDESAYDPTYVDVTNEPSAQDLVPGGEFTSDDEGNAPSDNVAGALLPQTSVHNPYSIPYLYREEARKDNKMALSSVCEEMINFQVATYSDTSQLDDKHYLKVLAMPVPLEVIGFLKIWDSLDDKIFPRYSGTRYLLSAEISPEVWVIAPSLPHLVCSMFQSLGNNCRGPGEFHTNTGLVLVKGFTSFGLKGDSISSMLRLDDALPEWVNGIPSTQNLVPDPSAGYEVMEIIGDLRRAKRETFLPQTHYNFMPILKLVMPAESLMGFENAARVNVGMPMTVKKYTTYSTMYEPPVLSPEAFIPFPEPKQSAYAAKLTHSRDIIFHTYTHHMRILATPGNRRIKTVCCSNAAFQQLPDDLLHLNQVDRLNMIQTIPELHLVIVGSQIGRVILMTMTRLATKLINANKHLSTGRGKARYGMRMEKILPTNDQEDKMLRPYATLLGIAVAPLQDAKNRRDRWRLFLHYSDCTILTYLLERRGQDIEVDVFGMVV